MLCPKCGETVTDGAAICPQCDYIVDSSFLGDDFLDESTSAHQSLGHDAVVLGGIDEEVALFSDATGSFLAAETSEVDRHLVAAAVYVGKSVQDLMRPEAVLRMATDVDKRKKMLSQFELHVLSFVNGERPVARLRKKTGLSGADLRIAIGMLAEKGAVVLAGNIARPAKGDEFADETNELTAEQLIESPPRTPASSVDFDERAIEVPRTNSTSPWDASRDPEPEDAAMTAQKARGFFETARTELKNGNRGRALVYAKLAADAAPTDQSYAELVRKCSVTTSPAITAESALFAEADLAEKRGHFPEALALLERAVAASPNAAHVYNRMGVLLATRFRKFAEASEALVRAVELDPNNVAYLNNLGKIIALANETGAKVSKRLRGAID